MEVFLFLNASPNQPLSTPITALTVPSSRRRQCKTSQSFSSACLRFPNNRNRQSASWEADQPSRPKTTEAAIWGNLVHGYLFA